MHTEIIRQFDDGRVLVRATVAGTIVECTACGENGPGLYMTGEGPTLCEKHADRLDDRGAAAEV
jgi:hypothetical protein